jgi:tol-pal system protein YbgF
MFPFKRKFRALFFPVVPILFVMGCQGTIQSGDRFPGAPSNTGIASIPIGTGGQSGDSSLIRSLKALRRGLANQEQRIDEERRAIQTLTDQLEKNRSSIDAVWNNFEKQAKELKERLDSVENELALLRSSGGRTGTQPTKEGQGGGFPSIGAPGEPASSGIPEAGSVEGAGTVPGSASGEGTESAGAPSAGTGDVARVIPPAGSPGEPVQPPPVKKPDPDADFNEALRVFRKDRSFPKARLLLNRFISSYPTHDLADDAQYLIGESYFEEKNYERAILAFNKVQVDYANGDKAPDSLLKEALSFLNLGDRASARELLGRVVQKYPGSEAEQAATKHLNSM